MIRQVLSLFLAFPWRGVTLFGFECELRSSRGEAFCCCSLPFLGVAGLRELVMVSRDNQSLDFKRLKLRHVQVSPIGLEV